MTTFDMLVVYPIREMLAKFASFVPTLVGALLILAFGWIFAKVIRDVILRILKAIQFDKIADKAGISEILTKGGIKHTAGEMLGSLVYWLVIIMVLVMTVNALGLTIASQLLERLFAYVPNVISALFVLVLGMFLANVVSGVVYATAKNTSVPNPELLGKISRWAIIVFAVTVSLEELGIAPLLVGTTFNILFGSICFGLALAFGLGGKDAAARFIEELRKKH